MRAREGGAARHCEVRIVGRTAARSSTPSKVLAPVAGRPFLEYLLIQLRDQGFRDVTLAVGHMAERIEAQFGSGQSLGLGLRYSREHEPLGTGGALRLALALTKSNDLLVLNGDSFFGIDFGALVDFHTRQPAAATIGLARVPKCARYGSVSIDETGRVLAFREKGETGSGIINGGIYVFTRSAIEQIAPDRAVSLERETLPGLVGYGLYGVLLDGYFADIGTPDAYEEACRHPRAFVSSTLGGYS
jgi:D-glycero-alpha-D-manno-heptose 1-phosphate guanylyltransferase